MNNSDLKQYVKHNYNEAYTDQYKAKPDGKNIVIGKDTKGKNLKYFAILAIIIFVYELRLGLN